MKEKTCCFTGHRDVSALKLPALKIRLKKEIEKLIDDGYETFVAGGAIGFDTLSAQAVLKLKKSYPHIKLHLALPCENQDKYWTESQKAEYARIFEEADSHEYVSRSYTRYCMFQRNRRMVDLSSAVIAYYDGEDKGGTAMTVKYAMQKQINIINIYGVSFG